MIGSFEEVVLQQTCRKKTFISSLAGENFAGKFQTNQPGQGLTLVMQDLHVPLAGTYLQQHFLRNVW